MIKDDTLWIVVAVCCVVLFIITVVITFIAFKMFCCRRTGPPRIIRLSAENQSAAVPMSDMKQNHNISDERQVEQHRNMMEEQVLKIFKESPHPEPSAPPLPPEYYMEYT